MPPKKDKKKGKSDIGPAVVDPADFLREPAELPVLGGVASLESPIGGDFFNSELLFGEWADDENWTEISDATKDIAVKYPIDFTYSEEKSILDHLGVARAAETDGKKGKKGGKNEVVSLEDTVADEAGNLLPRIFIGVTENEEDFLSTTIPCTFARLKLPPKTSSAVAGVVDAEGEKEVNSGEDSEAVQDTAPVSTEEPVAESEVKDGEPAEESTEASAPELIVEEDRYGVEIDAIMVNVFRTVARFFNTDHNITEAPFLWRAIYPQLPNGKPVLNKTGKYCVKLFVSGKWRKVTVLDVFPFSSNGQVSLASSSNPLELWPTILAKAVYTVYTALGYHHTMLGANAGEVALQKASFAAFAIHTLTGWAPSSPWTLADKNSCADLATIGLHLDEINFGGASIFEKGNIPRQDALVAVPEDEAVAKRQKTKKQLKDLILKRRMEKENLIKAIQKREDLISVMHSEVTKPFSEVYFLYTEPLASPSEPPEDCKEAAESEVVPPFQLYPVLAICHTNTADYMDTELLISWGVQEKILGNVPDPDPEVPASTPVTYQWVSVRELCDNGITYICGLDTKIRCPQVTAHSWHWDGADKVEESGGKGGKDKGKAAKGKDKGAAPDIVMNPIGMPYHGVDRGVFPPMLLKIDAEQLISAAEVEPIESAAVAEEAKNTENLSPADEEITVTGGASQSRPPTHFSICVQMQMDVCGVAVSPVETGAVGEEEETKDPSSEASKSKGPLFGLVDDVILVLQEIRSDKEEPLVMRVQLSKENPLPIARTTFHVPIEKIPTGSILFWVRVYTKSSVNFSFFSPAPIEVGMVNDLWEKSGGVSQVITDRAQPTYEKAEQVIFRLPLQLAMTDATTTEGEQEAQNSSDSVFVFLHTSDRSVVDTLSLVAIDKDRNETNVLPSINGNCFALTTRESLVTIIGRCMHASNNIPEFDWTAYVLSRQALKPPTELISVVPEKAPRQRYLGEYVANNKLRIFRDVVSVPSTEFPVSLRLSMHSAQDEDADSKGIELVGKESFIDVNEHLWFTARLLRKSDRKVVKEYQCRSLMQIYVLDKAGFLPDSDAPAEEEVPAKGKAKPADKKKGKDVGDLVEFILDVTVNEERMKVPEKWRSRFPFRFRKKGVDNALGGMDERSIDSSEVSQEPLFSWQLDILAGKVNGMQHDLYDLERYCAIKNKWDETENGRREKGHNSRFYLKRRAGQLSEEEATSAASEFLADALGKEESMLATREEMLTKLPQCVEYTTDHPENVMASMVSEDIVNTEKDANASDAAKNAAIAEATLNKLLQFNEVSRQNLLERIAAIRGQASNHYDEAVNLWQKREEYSADVEKKNEALSFFLERAKDAIETAYPDENVDPKAKKGKGKKK